MLNNMIILQNCDEFPTFMFDINGNINQETVADKQNQRGQSYYLGQADDKIKMYQQRYYQIKATIDTRYQNALKTDQQQFELCEVGSFCGSVDEKYTLGIIVERETNVYFIEDLFQKAQLDLSRVAPTNGIISPGLIVVIKGRFTNNRIQVSKIFHPASLSSQALPESFNQIDFFGAQTKVRQQLGILTMDIESMSLEQQQLEEQKRGLTLQQQKAFGIFDLNLNSFFKEKRREILSVIIISNFLLTSQEVLTKFSQLLAGMSDMAPVAFILLGEFFSFSDIQSINEEQTIDQSLNLFLQILNKYPEIKNHCYWFLIPSPNDLGIPLLPRPGLPTYPFLKLQSQIPYLCFPSNPCRLSFAGTAFNICRSGVLSALTKHSLVPLRQDIKLHEHLLETFIGQQHLSPVLDYTQPVVWKKDAELRVIRGRKQVEVIADGGCPEFVARQEQSLILNPGNFQKRATFAVCYPFNQMQVQLSAVH